MTALAVLMFIMPATMPSAGFMVTLYSFILAVYTAAELLSLASWRCIRDAGFALAFLLVCLVVGPV